MEEDLLTNLPQEIAIDIFSRLPIRTIISCKGVCKPWRHLLSTPDFVDRHNSKSVPGLVLLKRSHGTSFGVNSGRYEIVEFIDAPKSGRRRRRPSCKTVYNFSTPHRATLHSSANGLLLFVRYESHNLFVCNPLTREYVNLPPPTSPSYSTYGFGVSKVSRQYKVVRVCAGPYKFEVYTLGTGSLRSLVGVGGNEFPLSSCVFLNGSLYWLVGESSIRRFDLETELFSTFPRPSSRGYETLDRRPPLCALGDRLCLCVNDFDELVIWLMDGFGRWRKEFVNYGKRYGYRCDTFSAIRDLGDGKILLTPVDRICNLYYYSRRGERGSLKAIRLSKSRRNVFRVIYTPSFLPLRAFAAENVCSF